MELPLIPFLERSAVSRDVTAKTEPSRTVASSSLLTIYQNSHHVHITAALLMSK